MMLQNLLKNLTPAKNAILKKKTHTQAKYTETCLALSSCQGHEIFLLTCYKSLML